MMLSEDYFHLDWLFGFVVFLFQLGLGILAVFDQVEKIGERDIKYSLQLTILRISTILIAVYCQGDIFNAIALPIDLRLDGPHPWGEIPIEDNKRLSSSYWMSKILLPNILKFRQGSVVLAAS